MFSVVVFLAAVWLVLRSIDYVDRVSVYGAVSTAAEAFIHPLWFVALLVCAAAILTVSRVRRSPVPAPTVLAPEVQLRAEPPGKMSVVFSGNRDALVSDVIVDRDVTEEERIVDAFDALARRTVAFEGRESRRGGWKRQEIEEAHREIYALGLSIGTAILGSSGEAARALVDLPGDHLQLGIQPEFARIPWELMVPRPGGSYLWQLFSVSRQMRDCAAQARTQRARRGPARMLLLANPEAGVPGRDLPAAEREANELMDLAAGRPEAIRIIRKSPRSAEELTRVLRAEFDIIHFAGHTGRADGEGTWVLSEGEAVDPAELFASAARVPSLVFANACRSNPSGGGARAVDAAQSMLRLGVASYVCTLSELHDEGSAAFSAAFYRSALNGATLAGSMTRAREMLMGSHPITWANYVLYGDPISRL